MSTALEDKAVTLVEADARARRSFGRLAAFSAAYTYALIVVGGIHDPWQRGHSSPPPSPDPEIRTIPPTTISAYVYAAANAASRPNECRARASAAPGTAVLS